AMTDPLIGLANRAHLTEVLSRALARSARSGQSVAVLLTDLDGFKQVNDSLGHQAGDQLLVAFGRMLRRAVLGSDVVGRLGGDELAVVLHGIAAPQDAETVAQRLLAEMRQPVMVGDAVLQVRGSIALSGPGELNLDELMHHADMAMYRAKHHLGGGWYRYGAPDVRGLPDSGRPDDERCGALPSADGRALL
ncbi:GGDEF domain-containing protein, partial [Planomonospora parontospora]